MDNYTELDLETWDRAQHFQVFSMSQNPFYTVQFDVDVTDFYRYVKQHKLSFTLAMVYVTTAVANTIENYRYRFVDKKPVLFDKIDNVSQQADKSVQGRQLRF